MHEFSISTEVAQAVLDSAKEKGALKVLSLLLEIGEMTLLNGEQVKFWVGELLKGTLAEGAEIKIKNVKVRIECESCNYQGRPLFEAKGGSSLPGPLSCPKCRTFRVKVKKGDECILKRLQMMG